MHGSIGGRRFQAFWSTLRYCTASAMCGTATTSLPARSAMVRATRRARWVLRALQPSRAAAVFRNFRAAASAPRGCPAPSRPGPGWAALAGMGAGARRHHAFAHPRRCSRRAGPQQFVGRQGGHLHVQVDAVEQRAAELALVARNLVGRVAAGACGVTQEPARAGVHGRDQLEAGGKLALHGRAGDADVAAFQRFAQGFEGGPGKLRQLVEKQHAVVRQRDLARARRRAAADQGHRAGAVVGRAGRTLAPAARCRNGRPARPPPPTPALRWCPWGAAGRQSAAPACSCPSPGGRPSAGCVRRRPRFPVRGAPLPGP
jgi:hypothetical protein